VGAVRPALALVAASLLLALPASGASALVAGGRTLTIGNVSVRPQTLSATLAWTTSARARAVVQIGLTPDLGLWSKTLAGRSFRLAIGSLEPSTTYRFRIVAASGRGPAAVSDGSFTTQPIPSWSGSTTVGDRLFVDGQPFFPRMVFKPCPYQIDGALAGGANLFLGSGCGNDDGTLLADLRGRAYAGVAQEQRGLSGRGLIAWYYTDEADEHGSPGALPTLPPSRQTKRVTFLTLTNHFYSGAAPLPAGRGVYPAFIAKAEMVGFDLYPLTTWCRRRFAAVDEAQREFVALAAGKPTFQWIEAGTMSGCNLFVPTAQTVALETWLAIEGGAHGIGFFPSSWSPDIGSTIASLSRTIASLSPALLAPSLPVTSKPAGMVLAGARSLNGAVYVIASNASVRLTARRASISVPGLTARSVSVYGENRVVPVRRGVFRDDFAPMATHIYVAAPPGVPQAP
jgi:hypothetical protein